VQFLAAEAVAGAELADLMLDALLLSLESREFSPLL
jgi:hypothetical protein